MPLYNTENGFDRVLILENCWVFFGEQAENFGKIDQSYDL